MLTIDSILGRRICQRVRCTVSLCVNWLFAMSYLQCGGRRGEALSHTTESRATLLPRREALVPYNSRTCLLPQTQLCRSALLAVVLCCRYTFSLRTTTTTTTMTITTTITTMTTAASTTAAATTTSTIY